MNFKKVLVVVAHPDDEVLGMGGTIKRLTDNNVDVEVVFFTGGRNDSMNMSRFALAGLGVYKLSTFEYDDQRLDTVPFTDNLVKDLESYIDRYQPDTVFTHSNTDVNLDHQIVYNTVLTATRPYPGQSVKNVYSFEVLSSSEWNFERPFTPDTFIDITPNLEYKLMAMSLYFDEIRNFPHPRSVKGIVSQASIRGMTIGVGAAEAFKTIRQIF